MKNIIELIILLPFVIVAFIVIGGAIFVGWVIGVPITISRGGKEAKYIWFKKI